MSASRSDAAFHGFARLDAHRVACFTRRCVGKDGHRCGINGRIGYGELQPLGIMAKYGCLHSIEGVNLARSGVGIYTGNLYRHQGAVGLVPACEPAVGT